MNYDDNIPDHLRNDPNAPYNTPEDNFIFAKPVAHNSYYGFRFTGNCLVFARKLIQQIVPYNYCFVEYDSVNTFRITLLKEYEKGAIEIRFVAVGPSVSCICNMPKGRYLQSQEDPAIFTLS